MRSFLLCLLMPALLATAASKEDIPPRPPGVIWSGAGTEATGQDRQEVRRPRAANPLQPGRRGSYAPTPTADEFRVGFWDRPKFDPLHDRVPVPLGLLSAGITDEYWLVQFAGPVSDGQVRATERVLGFKDSRIPVTGPSDPRSLESLNPFIGFHSRYLAFVRTNRAGLERVRALSFIRWAGPYHPGLKYWSGTLAAAGYGRVSVVLFRDADLDRAGQELAGLGLAPVRTGATAQFKVIEVDCSREQVAEIARLPYVKTVEEWHESRPENADAQWVIQTGTEGKRRIWDLDVVGADEILGFIDGRIDHRHYAFRDTALVISDTGEYPNHRKIVAIKRYPPGRLGASSSHGTHVGGIIAGNDSVLGGNSPHKGHGREARLAHLFPVPSPPGGDFTEPLNMITNDLYYPALRPRAISSSWETGTTGQYTSASASFDNFAWFNRDIVLIKSCGNLGQSSRYQITEPGNSKSIIAVAAVRNGTGSDKLYGSSSRGPAPDGRVKPDISAPGENIMSARANTTNSYVARSGTSVAAPAVNGAVGLLRSYLRKGYYPTGRPNPADAFGYVSAALLKAMLLVSADPNVDDYTVPSDYIGWGRVNLDSVLFLRDSLPDARKLLVYDDTVGLATGEFVEYVFRVNGSMPLRAGVVWTDTAAAAGANPALINDLDARLTGPDGTLYLGNHYSAGHSVPNPGGIPDRLNPLELFRVHDPEPGVWTLRVAGYTVPMGKAQPYALVVTGGLVVDETFIDVGVTGIIAPADTVELDSTVVPTAVVRNYSTMEVTFPVYFAIGDGYADSTEVLLAVGARDTVRFAEWVPDSLGRLEFSCRVVLTGDMDPSNDLIRDTVEVVPEVGIFGPDDLPVAFAFEGAKPTPFRGGTGLRYALPRTAEVDMAVYNATGRRVRVLVSGPVAAGRHMVHWDGRDDAGRKLAPGVYLGRFAAGDSVRLGKLVKLD